MEYKILLKTQFNQFVADLMKISKLAAPAPKESNNYAFKEITNPGEISMHHIPTILAPKKYFMPQEEKIVEFDKSTGKSQGVIEYEKWIVMGIHTCDLAGIGCLDMVFDENPKDPSYSIRKKNLTVIGIECNKYCDEYASCFMMGNHNPKSGYDLFMTDIGDKFIIHINTEVGKVLSNSLSMLSDASVSDKKALDDLRAKKKSIFKQEANVPMENLKDLFDKSTSSPVWKSVGDKCIACGNCTNVCPTCYCFDIADDINLDLTTGSRIRKWDSCQTESFAKVAGNENFRKERSSRQKHRYMRKFSYSVSKWNSFFCTGCGRCSRTCMAKINLKETINELAG